MVFTLAEMGTTLTQGDSHGLRPCGFRWRGICHGNVLRFLVPLTATEDQLGEGLDVVEAGLAAL